MQNETPAHRCPVCSAENSEHATVCTSCGSYLQNRVPTLDLFATAWGVLEHPIKTFGTVTRAEHKNYSLFLFAAGGILPAMVCFHLFRLGNFFPSLLIVLPVGMISGLMLGLLSAPLGAGATAVTSRLVGGDSSFRNGLGVTSYSLVPLIAIGIVTLPIQWLTFGEYFFTQNPHPATINATSYWALNAFQLVGIVWSGVLLFLGIRVGMRLNTARTLAVWLGVLVILGGGWIGTFEGAVGLFESLGLHITY